MKLSLIQTSQDRKEEILRFINCLNQQKGIDFQELQYIFIDQGNNLTCFDNLHPDIHFDYFQTPPCSLSCARNIGLQHIKARYVCFPDDDCWYAPDTLASIFKYLETEDIDGLTCRVTNENGIPYNVYPRSPQWVSMSDWCGTSSITIFFKYQKDILFDVNLGVGSPYSLGGGEETDYLLNHLRLFHYRIKFIPSITIYHPISKLKKDKAYLQKNYLYARGHGYLYRKHKFSGLYIIYNMLRPLGGIVINSVRGDFYMVRRSYYILKGRLEGFMFHVK